MANTLKHEYQSIPVQAYVPRWMVKRVKKRYGYGAISRLIQEAFYHACQEDEMTELQVDIAVGRGLTEPEEATTFVAPEGSAEGG